MQSQHFCAAVNGNMVEQLTVVCKSQHGYAAQASSTTKLTLL